MATKRRRPNKPGGTWIIDYRINGKRRVESLHTRDERIADLRLADCINRETAVKTGCLMFDPSWRQFCDDYLAHRKEQVAAHVLTHSTYAREAGAFRMLEKTFPIQKLSEVTPDLMLKLRASWREAGRGLYARNRDIRTIKSGMYWAQSRYQMNHHVWRGVKYEREPKGRLRYFTVKDLESLLGVCEGMWGIVALLGACCGLRPSEIHHAVWDGLDLLNGKLHVMSVPCDCRKCLLEHDGHWFPKSESGDRWVPVETALLARLKEFKASGKGPWIVSEDGRRPTEQSMGAYFTRLIRKAGLSGTLYTLRHTYGAHQVSSGKVTLETLKGLMGHASITQTEVYAHLMPEALNRAVAILPQMTSQAVAPA